MIIHQVFPPYAVDQNEIELVDGTLITNILRLDDDWWQGTNINGQVGLFPATYVEVQGGAPAPGAVPVAVAAPASDAVSHGNGRCAITLYDYDAAEVNEISFGPEQQITNIDFVSEEWWSGTNAKGETGLCIMNINLVPCNYVELQN